jgi:hypothetical protein
MATKMRLMVTLGGFFGRIRWNHAGFEGTVDPYFLPILLRECQRCQCNGVPSWVTKGKKM